MVSNPIIARAYNLLSITDINIKNLAKNPPSGGIPNREKKVLKMKVRTMAFLIAQLSLQFFQYNCHLLSLDISMRMYLNS